MSRCLLGRLQLCLFSFNIGFTISVCPNFIYNEELVCLSLGFTLYYMALHLVTVNL